MSEDKLVRILKLSIFIGLCLLILGIYLHNFSEAIESMGVRGIIISAVCIAFGLIFSLPTKMYLTFILVSREQKLMKEEDNKRS